MMKIPSVKKGNFSLDVKMNGQKIFYEDITERIEANQYKLTYALIKEILETKRINFDPKKIERWDFIEAKYMIIPKDYSLNLERESSSNIELNLHNNLRKSSNINNISVNGMDSIMFEMENMRGAIFHILNEVKDIKLKMDEILMNFGKVNPSLCVSEQKLNESTKDNELGTNVYNPTHLDIIGMEKGISRVRKI